MNEKEKIILRLAAVCENPEEFIFRLERLSGVSPIEKGDFFLEVGNILYRLSYSDLAFQSWNHALKYLISARARALSG